MRQGLGLAALGAMVGIGLAAVLASALRGVLYGTSSLDPIAWGAALTVLFGAAIAANLVPARRAMRVNPITALRTE
jgi:ABC-type antimicrobial peptide transport system permease subunit